MRDNLNHTNTKKLSVITVTYNAEHTLERTLKSVREQTYPAIEHIIVDGNSNDGTVALIHRYENERLKWISEPDKGLYDAMNKGIKMATGDYLCFLNAGDTFYDTDTVQKIFASIDEDHSPDILYGETAIVDDNGRFLHMRRLQAPKNLTWKSFKHGIDVYKRQHYIRFGSSEQQANCRLSGRELFVETTQHMALPSQQ